MSAVSFFNPKYYIDNECMLKSLCYGNGECPSLLLEPKAYIMKQLKRMACEIKASYEKKNEIGAVKIQSSSSVNEYIRKVFPVDLEHREALVCVYLNRANNTIGYSTISIGGVAGTLCDPKMVFQHGLICNASSIILVHNHPSQNLKPSNSDKELTNKIKNAGKIMDMPLLDHLIISKGESSYYSFADEGML